METWKARRQGQGLETYTIITTDPNEVMEPLHDRMPVILRPEDYGRRLEPGDPERPPVDLLRSYPADDMKVWKVGARVGNVRNNDSECVAPL